jgi:hypothetical protein
MKKKETPEIPLYTKWGIRITAFIILLLTAMILKNCLGSFIYGVATEQELQNQYYELGYRHGRQKAQGLEKEAEPDSSNPLLRKLYHKGYRDGWDSAHLDYETPGSTGPQENDQK